MQKTSPVSRAKVELTSLKIMKSYDFCKLDQSTSFDKEPKFSFNEVFQPEPLYNFDRKKTEVG